MIKAIMDTWGGALINMPEISQWGDNVYLFKLNGDIRGIFCIAKVDELWNTNTDFCIPENSLRELFVLDNMFLPSVMIAVEYKDRFSYIKVVDLLCDCERYFHNGVSFIPKELFELIIKG